MGVKTAITLKDLPPSLTCTLLIPSENGVSDSVYFTDLGVLKIFETATPQSLQEERKLLRNLSALPVSRPIGEIFYLQEKPCMLYTQLRGKSLTKAEDAHIIQIAEFMRRFHTHSANLTSANTPLFERSRLQSLIIQTGEPQFQKIFDALPLELSHDGVIHGDLFLDNALFEGEILSGVFDFIEACEGDFLFDLAVVAVAWCLEENEGYAKIDLLVEHYGRDISRDDFIPYVKYALLYYATTRYLHSRDYQSLLNKIKLLDAMEEVNR